MAKCSGQAVYSMSGERTGAGGARPPAAPGASQVLRHLSDQRHRRDARPCLIHLTGHLFGSAPGGRTVSDGAASPASAANAGSPMRFAAGFGATPPPPPALGVAPPSPRVGVSNLRGGCAEVQGWEVGNERSRKGSERLRNGSERSREGSERGQGKAAKGQGKGATKSSARQRGHKVLVGPRHNGRRNGVEALPDQPKR